MLRQLLSRRPKRLRCDVPSVIGHPKNGDNDSSIIMTMVLV